MDPQEVLFVIGSLIALLAPVLFVYVALQLPAVMRQERSAATLTGPLWLVFGTFCIGAGLVVVSAFEAFLMPVALSVMALGVVATARAVPMIRRR